MRFSLLLKEKTFSNNFSNHIITHAQAQDVLQHPEPEHLSRTVRNLERHPACFFCGLICVTIIVRLLVCFSVEIHIFQNSRQYHVMFMACKTVKNKTTYKASAVWSAFSLLEALTEHTGSCWAQSDTGARTCPSVVPHLLLKSGGVKSPPQHRSGQVDGQNKKKFVPE